MERFEQNIKSLLCFFIWFAKCAEEIDIKKLMISVSYKTDNSY